MGVFNYWLEPIRANGPLGGLKLLFFLVFHLRGADYFFWVVDIRPAKILIPFGGRVSFLAALPPLVPSKVGCVFFATKGFLLVATLLFFYGVCLPICPRGPKIIFPLWQPVSWRPRPKPWSGKGKE